MKLFWAAHRWGSTNPCHTDPTIIKVGTFMPYVKKIRKKYINHETCSLNSADISIFFKLKPANFDRSIKKRYRLYVDCF